MDLYKAIQGLIEERKKVDAIIRALEALSSGEKPRKKRVLSEEARRRIAEGQRKRRARERRASGG
jgi:hypothetical protein